MSNSTLKNSVVFVPPWSYPHAQLTLAEARAARPNLTVDAPPASVAELPARQPTPPDMDIDGAGSSSDSDDDDGANDPSVRSMPTPRDERDKITGSDADSGTTPASASSTPRADLRLDLSTVSKPTQLATSSTAVPAPPLSEPGLVVADDNEAKIDPFASFTWHNANLVAHNNETLLGYMCGGAGAYTASGLHNATWCGFGPIMRPKVWAVRLGFALAERLDLRRLVRTRGLEYIDYTDILKDVQRTYSPLDQLPPPCVSARRQDEAIYRLLCAMASYNHSIGYAQSMNRLALVLVDVFAEPWQQFWAFDHLLTRVLPHYFMRNASVGVLVDIAVLAYYVRRRDRELSRALLRHDDPMTPIPNAVLYTLCVQWLSTLFAGCMRFGNVVRLWDEIIVHGPAALFTFVYRVLVLNRAVIIAERDLTAVVGSINRWLEELESLDVLGSVKMSAPIEAADVEARRAAQLNALLTTSAGERIFRRGFTGAHVDNYINMGRGCVCATPPPPASPVASKPAAASAGGAFVSALAVRTSSLTSTTAAAFDERRLARRGASVPQWNVHHSVDERSLMGSDSSPDHSEASFTTDTMPLAAPLRGTSASTTRHKRSGTRVASSNTTIGSVFVDDDRSNGVDG